MLEAESGTVRGARTGKTSPSKDPDALTRRSLPVTRACIRKLDHESNLLRNAKARWERRGWQLRCAPDCDEDIKPKRLDAVPWTKYCITCQEASDRHEFESESGDKVDELLAA
jgi:DnaK suppressor protein